MGFYEKCAFYKKNWIKMTPRPQKSSDMPSDHHSTGKKGSKTSRLATKKMSNDHRAKIISTPPKLPGWVKMKEDIVISGVAGRFPDCLNIDQFKDNLYNKVDMITESDGRWPVGYIGLPPKAGNVPEVDKFDAAFFGWTDEYAHIIEHQIRILFELAWEVMWDAGQCNSCLFIKVYYHKLKLQLNL